MTTKPKPNKHAEKQSSNQPRSSYERLIERFVKWAETCSEIRAAVVVGSRARLDHPADEWADLDVMLIVTDPERFVSKVDWLGKIGGPLLTFLEPTSTGGEIERRVLFEGMLDVDFAIIPKRTAETLIKDEIKPDAAVEVSNTFGRGMRVLLDKDGMMPQLRMFLSSMNIPTPSPPTEHEFLEVVNDFLYHAVFTAKHLRRGELWWTITCLDCYMQRLLLRMVEWHARTNRGWNYDTWFRGRFLEEWADPRVLEELRTAFAHYDEEDVKQALSALISLFRFVATETAEKLRYPYPYEADRRITEWISKCL